MSECHFCNKNKLNLMILNLPEFGEIRVCLKCWNSLRPPENRIKSEKYGALVHREETDSLILVYADKSDLTILNMEKLRIEK